MCVQCDRTIVLLLSRIRMHPMMGFWAHGQNRQKQHGRGQQQRKRTAQTSRLSVSVDEERVHGLVGTDICLAESSSCSPTCLRNGKSATARSSSVKKITDYGYKGKSGANASAPSFQRIGMRSHASEQAAAKPG